MRLVCIWTGGVFSLKRLGCPRCNTRQENVKTGLETQDDWQWRHDGSRHDGSWWDHEAAWTHMHQFTIPHDHLFVYLGSSRGYKLCSLRFRNSKLVAVVGMPVLMSLGSCNLLQLEHDGLVFIACRLLVTCLFLLMALRMHPQHQHHQVHLQRQVHLQWQRHRHLQLQTMSLGIVFMIKRHAVLSQCSNLDWSVRPGGTSCVIHVECCAHYEWRGPCFNMVV